MQQVRFWATGGWESAEFGAISIGSTEVWHGSRESSASCAGWQFVGDESMLKCYQVP